MSKNRFPKEWDEARVRRVLAHYENQTAKEAAQEDAATFKNRSRSMVEIPPDLMPVVRELIGLRQQWLKPITAKKKLLPRTTSHTRKSPTLRSAR